MLGIAALLLLPSELMREELMAPTATVGAGRVIHQIPVVSQRAT